MSSDVMLAVFDYILIVIFFVVLIGIVTMVIARYQASPDTDQPSAQTQAHDEKAPWLPVAILFIAVFLLALLAKKENQQK